MPPEATSYDEVPYASHPFAQSHPDRLATVSTLFGLRPPPVEQCRVLELGCASGGNLIPMAEALPGSTFVGVDLSERQIASGRERVRALGLSNVELRHASILDLTAADGTFDYVICHGVYSWVPAAVRDKILTVCGTQLAPNGVAYVSYNTYPGWHMRGMIRDMMRFHATQFAAPHVRTQQARALLDFLARSVPADGGPYSSLLTAELAAVRRQADHYLYHEHLEEVNEPLYFHEFVSRAARHGLRYLGESRVGTMVTDNFGAAVESSLRAVAADQIKMEQYMDFLRNRTFRETLLVPAGAAPDWAIDPRRLYALHVASGSRAENGPEDGATTYLTPSGARLTTAHPLMNAAMGVLAAVWPAAVPFDELLRRAGERLAGRAAGAELAGDAAALASGLLDSYLRSDLVELRAAPVALSPKPGEAPVSPPSARHGVESGAVTNRRHELVPLDDLERRFVPLLDGTRSRPTLADELVRLIDDGELTISLEGQVVSDPAALREAVTELVDQALESLAQRGLLLG